MSEKYILLRGLGRLKQHWGAFPNLLGDKVGHENVICLDIPGCGDLKNVNVPLKIADFVPQIISHYQDIIPQKFTLIGQSLGGMIAWSWALQHPENVERLFLINSSCARSKPWERLKPRAYREIFKAVTAKNYKTREKIFASLLCNYDAVIKQMTKQWQDTPESLHPTKKNLLRQLLAATQWQGAPVSMRTDVLTSKGDRLVDFQCSKIIAQITGGSLHIHQAAGHELSGDDPEWTLSAILGRNLRG